MRVLVACEFTGTVRDAFTGYGHDAWSCDFLQTESPGNHLQGNVLGYLDRDWDLLIAHPPCRYLSRAGARWWKGRETEAELAYQFVLALWDCGIPRVVIENPIGQLNQLWRKPDQTIEPWQFGDPYTKRTNLWLKNVPPLLSTRIEMIRTNWLPSNTSGFRRGQRSRQGVVQRGKSASRTFPGIAAAMAQQWSGLL